MRLPASLMFALGFPHPLRSRNLKHHHDTRQLAEPNCSALRRMVPHKCRNNRTLKKLHAFALRSAFDLASNTLEFASMYAGFGDLNSAVTTLKSSLQPNTFMWNVVLKALVDSGLSEAALSLFSAMRGANFPPDHFTLPLINRAILSLQRHLKLGEAIHCLGVQMGFISDIFFCNTMLEVYTRNDNIKDAHRLFDEMPTRDVVSWTSLISGYVRIGNVFDAFRLFHEMQMIGIEANSVTIVIMLQACSFMEDVVLGRQFYSLSIKRGFEAHESVQNSILTVLAKAGCLEEAESIMTRMDERNVISWNIMISAYCSIGELTKVIDCYEKMKTELIPSHETFSSVLSAFAKRGDFFEGQKVHGCAVKAGKVDTIMQASLMDFYAKCGELEESVQLFEEVKEKSSILWNVMLSGFVSNGHFEEAIRFFHKMQIAGFEPGLDIVKGIIVTYSHLGALRLGKGVHGYAIRNGLFGCGGNKYLETSLLNMYAKCGSILLARRCFDSVLVKDIITWSSMIEGYAIHGIGEEALKLFYRMEEEGCRPNSIAFLSVLSACSHSGLVREGCEVFDSMMKKYGIKPEVYHYTCMVDLLGRSGKLQEAQSMIRNMKVKPDSRIWGCLLASCRLHSDRELGIYVAERIIDLEPENVGYHVVLCNIHAAHERWNEAEFMRKILGDRDLEKKPGWSCIEVREKHHMFIVGDRSHSQVQEIYVALDCLARQIEEGGCLSMG